MADIVTNEKNLHVVAEFTDGDDRTMIFSNPRSDLTWADIEALNASASAVLIGDRAQANFYRMKEAYIKQTNTLYFDLS